MCKAWYAYTSDWCPDRMTPGIQLLIHTLIRDSLWSVKVKFGVTVNFVS